jgi:hypothetical protein
MANGKYFEYDLAKSKWLRKERGLGFEEIIEYIESGWVLEIIPEPNQQKHPNQWIYEIAIDGYVFEVPFYELKGRHILKTLYPSRRATKKHLDQGTLA